jgi:hypothetical protein
MDKRTAICNYLKKHHTGKENAVFSRELERLFSLDGRALRRKISSLRQDGHPICSDGSGYYYAENQKEINATICRLNTLVTRISNARTGMLYASVQSDEPVSVSINIELK